MDWQKTHTFTHKKPKIKTQIWNKENSHSSSSSKDLHQEDMSSLPTRTNGERKMSFGIKLMGNVALTIWMETPLKLAREESTYTKWCPMTKIQ